MKKTKYCWECNWTNGKGGFDPDLEGCNKKGKAIHDIPLAAALEGLKHDCKHGWCGWGYAPWGWRNHSTYVCKVTPTGKKKYLGSCEKIANKA